jgi:polysaccharide pyruvyl transferase WcaK-like protein
MQLCTGSPIRFRKLGAARFSVITANPAKVRERYGFDAYAPKQTPLKLMRNLLSSDVLVFTGGTPFYEAKPHMTYYAGLARAAHAHGIPILVFGISMRKLTSRYCRFMMRQIAHRAAVLGAREARSLQLFSTMVGTRNTAALVPDAATQMVPSSPARAAELLRRIGIDPTAKTVAICLRDFRANAAFQKHHYSRHFDAPTLKRYHQSIRDLAVHLVRNHDANVLFCPMHTNPPDDDRAVMRLVAESITDPGIRKRCIVMTQQQHPRDMKAILGSMYAAVGVRFHSLVLATSMNVPSLGVAYALKNNAILRQMGQGEFVQDLTTTNSETIIDLFDRLAERHADLTEVLCNSNRQLDELFDQRLQEIKDSGLLGVKAKKGSGLFSLKPCTSRTNDTTPQHH